MRSVRVSQAKCVKCPIAAVSLDQLQSPSYNLAAHDSLLDSSTNCTRCRRSICSSKCDCVFLNPKKAMATDNTASMADKRLASIIITDPESGFLSLSQPGSPKNEPLKGASFLQDCWRFRKNLAREGTVLQGIWWKVLALCLYSVSVCLCDAWYLHINFRPTVVPIMGTVIGFLLVFRTNTAYDRYYEGRKVWSSMTQVARRLITCVWIAIPEHSPEVQAEKKAIINCLVAFPVAVKHHLREEYLYDYDDLRVLIGDFKPFASKFSTTPSKRNKKNIRRATRRLSRSKFDDQDSIDGSGQIKGNLPVELVHCVSVYIQSLLERKLCDTSNVGTMNLILTRFLDDLGSLERILRTPLPLAYTVHLTQAVWLHLILIPIQIVSTMGWWTIAAIGFTSFTLLGILQISAEIENPFGYDSNDLPLDHYCEVLKREVDRILKQELRTIGDLFYEPAPGRDTEREAEDGNGSSSSTDEEDEGKGKVNEGFEPESDQLVGSNGSGGDLDKEKSSRCRVGFY